jgi:hypothetical protein
VGYTAHLAGELTAHRRRRNAAIESAVTANFRPGARGLALPSATAALATALEILGVGPGDAIDAGL